MPRQKENEKLKVVWLQNSEDELAGTAGGASLKHTTIEGSKVVFDPFVVTEKQQTVDTGALRIQALWESGKLTDEQALAAMRRAERVNRSQGRDILYDNRMLTPNRVNRYVEWATSQGQNPVEARKYAVSEILKQAVTQGGFGGKNRGGVTTSLSIEE